MDHPLLLIVATTASAGPATCLHGLSASPAFADIDRDGDLDLFIGEYFGNRQHSTVISAQKKVESWIDGKESLQVGNTSMQVPDILRSLEASLQVG